MIPKIIAEVSFNRPQDETGSNSREVRLYASKKEVYFTFEIGKHPDDTINLVFLVDEFMSKLGRTLVEQEVDED